MAAPVLRIIVDHRLVEELHLQGDVCLGRASDNDVILGDAAVSGHHGRIEAGEQGWRYVDLGSANGSLVAAGPRLRKGQDVELAELTQIMIGKTVLEFRPGEPSAAPLPSVTRSVSTAPAGMAPSAPGGRATAPAAGPPASAAGSAPVGASGSPSVKASGDAPGKSPDIPSGHSPGGAAGGSSAAASGEPPGGPRGDAPGASAGEASGDGSGGARGGPPRDLPSAPPTTTDLGPAAAPASAIIDPASLHPRVVVVAEGDPFTADLPMPRAVLGRAGDCDVTLDVASISSHHAEIVWTGEGFELADLGSTNGTRMGLGKLTAPARLPNGSHVILGTVDLLFVHDGPVDGPEGSPVDAAGLLDWLVERRKLDQDQAQRVMQAHRDQGRSVEELLVSSGMLSPGALTELRHNAGRRLLGLSDEQATRLAPAMVWMVLTAIALVALAVSLLL